MSMCDYISPYLFPQLYHSWLNNTQNSVIPASQWCSRTLCTGQALSLQWCMMGVCSKTTKVDGETTTSVLQEYEVCCSSRYIHLCHEELSIATSAHGKTQVGFFLSSYLHFNDTDTFLFLTLSPHSSQSLQRIKQTNKPDSQPCYYLRTQSNEKHWNPNSYRSLEPVTRPSLGRDHLTNQAGNDRNSPETSGTLQNASSGSESTGFHSGVTGDAGGDTGTFETRTEELKRSVFLSNHFPTAPISSAAETRTSTTVLPDITVQTLTSPRSLSSFSLLSDADMETKEAKTKLQDPKLSTVRKMVNTQTTAYTPSTNHSFSKLYKSVSDITKPQAETGPSNPQLQTTAPLRSPPPPQPLRSYTKALSQTIPTQTPQTDQSQSDTPPEAPSISPLPKPHSQTGAPPDFTFELKQTQSSVTPTSGFYPVFETNQGKEVTNHQFQANIKTTALIFAFPSTTPSPASSGSTLQSSASSSSPSLPPSTLIHPRYTTPLYPSRSSTEVMVHPSLRSTLFTHSSSSSLKKQPKTAPARSAPPSPSPISVPPHFPAVQPSPTYPVTYSNSSDNPSPAPLFPPVLTNPSSPLYPPLPFPLLRLHLLLWLEYHLPSHWVPRFLRPPSLPPLT